MKYRRHIPSVLALTLAVVAGLVVSCDDLIYDSSSSSAIGSQASSPDAIEITFTVSTLSATSTRADDESTTSTTYSSSYTSIDADTYEQTINSMQVYLYDSSGNYLLKVTQTRLVESSTGIYSYTGTLPIDDSSAFTSTFTADSDGTYSFSGKIMVLANCDTYPAETTTTDTDGTTTTTVATAGTLSGDTSLSGLTYTASSSDGGTLTDGIPMWGITTVSGLDLQQGICATVDDIYLIRAAAKITVAMDSNTTSLDYSITACTLSSYNTTGLCLPADYSSVSTTKGLSLDCVNLPTGVTASSSSIAFANDDDTWTLYLPEMKTTLNSMNGSTVYTTTPYISVTIQSPYTETTTDSEGNSTTSNIVVTKALYLCEYSDGEATSTNYTLTRNHVYAYTLSTSELLVTSSVSDWEEQTSSVGWEVDDDNITFQPAGWKAEGESDTGDTDAYYCVLTYPRWGTGTDSDGNTVKADKHLFVIDSKSYASYEFTLSPSAQFTTGTITWKAYLTNPTYFAFNTNSNGSDIARTDEYQYNVTMGVNREECYTIKVGPNGSRRWENVVTESTKENGVTTTTVYYDTDIRWSTDVTDSTTYSGSTSGVSGIIIEGIRTYAYNNMADYDNQCIYSDGDTIIAVYTDLFILATGSGLVYPLNINPTADDESLFTPNRFPGGTKDLGYVIPSDDPYYPGEHITLREHQWMRIYWTMAETKDKSNSYDAILTKITEASDDDEKWYDP